MGFQNFYELNVWKKARSFKIAIYNLTKRFPVHERFELTNQIRRSARSIPANISEGHGRRTPKDQHNFCVIARGSHSETLNHLIDAYDCGYMSKDELILFQNQWAELTKLLNGYMAYLQSKMKPGTSPAQNIEEGLTQYSIQSDIQKETEGFCSHLSI